MCAVPAAQGAVELHAAAVELEAVHTVVADEPIQLSSQHTISCWLQKSGGYNHGTETLEKAFQNSCNPVFTQLAQKIGLKKYYSYVRMLGFYDKTCIDLPAEGKGIFHKDPTVVDMSVLAYGESSTVTPIQLITAYCAIINGGDLLVPHVVKYITDSNGNIVDEIEPEVVRTVFSEDTCKRVRTLMEGVVTDGTGSAGKVAGYSVAGKTSTSTIDVGDLKGAHVLSFSCYAPSYDPKIAVLVVINKSHHLLVKVIIQHICNLFILFINKQFLISFQFCWYILLTKEGTKYFLFFKRSFALPIAI